VGPSLVGFELKPLGKGHYHLQHGTPHVCPVAILTMETNALRVDETLTQGFSVGNSVFIVRNVPGEWGFVQDPQNIPERQVLLRISDLPVEPVEI
jgi:hypothetical protein